jgi:hypothetical protein
VEHHLVLAELGGTTWADVEPGAGAELVGFLQRMVFMLRVEPVPVTDGWAVLTVAGPRAAAVLEAAGLPVPDAPDGVVATGDGGWVRRMPPIGDGRSDVVDLLVPRAALRERADALLAAGAVPAGLDAYEALRVEARRPRFGVDSDHRTIPNELQWLQTAVHLDKGCYRGQETVAHVANLGRPPRRLVRLHLDGSVRETLPERGSEIFADGVGVGRLTSAAYHHELGPIGLALLKYMTPDGEVVVGAGEAGVSASIESIVERDDSPRPGQAARSALRGRSLL